MLMQSNAIDPEFLAALPPDIRAFCPLVSAFPSPYLTLVHLHVPSEPSCICVPATRMLMLCPSSVSYIAAERCFDSFHQFAEADVLRQHQRAQQQAEPEPPADQSLSQDMDNASFIATVRRSCSGPHLPHLYVVSICTLSCVCIR